MHLPMFATGCNVRSQLEPAGCCSGEWLSVRVEVWGARATRNLLLAWARERAKHEAQEQGGTRMTQELVTDGDAGRVVLETRWATK